MEGGGKVGWGEKLQERQLHVLSGRNKYKGKDAAVGHQGNERGTLEVKRATM